MATRPWPRNLAMRRDTRAQRRLASCSRVLATESYVCCQVMVAKAVEGMLAGHVRGKQSGICLSDGVELGVVAAVFRAALAQTVEFRDSLAFHSHVRQGVQVTVIGLLPDLTITPEVGHALAHRYPAPGVVGTVQHLELPRIVDRGLDA